MNNINSKIKKINIKELIKKSRRKNYLLCKNCNKKVITYWNDKYEMYFYSCSKCNFFEKFEFGHYATYHKMVDILNKLTERTLDDFRWMEKY